MIQTFIGATNIVLGRMNYHRLATLSPSPYTKMSHRPNITLYYDVQSPFAYLAFYFLDVSQNIERNLLALFSHDMYQPD